MVVWRELVGGVVLCVMCCAAVIYSFSSPVGRHEGHADTPDKSQTAVGLAVSSASNAGDDRPRIDPASAIDVVHSDVMITAADVDNPSLDVAGPSLERRSAVMVQANDEMKWIRLPAEFASPLFPVEAMPEPAIANRVVSQREISEPLAMLAAGQHSNAEAQHDEDSPQEGLGESELLHPESLAIDVSLGGPDDNPSEPEYLPPEFLAIKPSLADPSDLLMSDPGSHLPSESTQPDPDLSAEPGMERADQDRVSDSPNNAEPAVWHPPAALLARMERLAEKPQTRAWAEDATRQVEGLGLAVQARSAADTARFLDTLEHAVAEATALANQVADPSLAAHLQRTAYALRRRLDLWQYTELLVGVSNRESTALCDWDELALSLEQVESYVGDSTVGQAWREYLLLDALRRHTVHREAEAEHLGRTLARESLQRLTQIPMDRQQRQFVSSEPVRRLKTELQRLAAAPVGIGQFLENLERYEQTRTTGDARLLARDYQRLALADSEAEQALAASLATHYRNANLRFAVSESLLNRLMPTRDPEFAPVNDIVLGIPAQGQRTTSTEMQVSLTPDAHRARLALDVHGRIYSQTTSTSGPATFLTNSLGWYIARKPLELGLDGIEASPAEVRVSSDLRLRGVRTDFDGLPLLGTLASSVARSQHAQNRPAANAEIRARIYQEAKSRIDREADERLAEVSDRLRAKLLEPMRRLRLDPVVVDAQTTEDRLNMRVRLAGEDQLGSHTPRPRAPGDSLASFQVHESAINNVLDRLDLDGRTFTLAELSRHVADRLNNEGWLNTTPEHEEVSITFAASNAVSVRCEEGRIGIVLLIDRLRQDRRVWRNFQVQAFYRPETQNISAELVRDGVIQLSGDRLPLGAQIALRGIFVRIFSPRRPWDLLPRPIAENPNLADLEITQFTIDDGWVGLALGPRRAVSRARRLLR